MKKKIRLRPELVEPGKERLAAAIENDLNLRIEVLRLKGYTFRQAHAAVEQMLAREWKANEEATQNS